MKGFLTGLDLYYDKTDARFLNNDLILSDRFLENRFLFCTEFKRLEILYIFELCCKQTNRRPRSSVLPTPTDRAGLDNDERLIASC